MKVARKPGTKWTRLSSAQSSGLVRCRSLLVYDAFEAQVTKRVKASFLNENTDLAVFLGLLTWLPNAVHNYWAPYHTRCHLFTAHFAKKVPLRVSVGEFVDVLRSIAWTWSLWTPSAHLCLCSCCCLLLLLLSLLFSFCSWSLNQFSSFWTLPWQN